MIPEGAAPTVGGWMLNAVAGTNDASVKLYFTYWRRLVDLLGADTPLASVSSIDIKQAAKAAHNRALTTRRNTQGGVYAEEHLIAAARKFFELALREGLISRNPAAYVEKPRRPSSRRHALSDEQIAEIFRHGRDRDTYLLRFFLETGCRREGVINLVPGSVRVERQTVMLDEKGSRVREQPISSAMLLALQDPATGMFDWTRRRIDGVWEHIRKQLPWAADIGLSSHWMRHTAITRMEQHSGYAIAAAFAGHEAKGTTATYVHLTVNDVARAFSGLYGEPHPLALHALAG